MGKKKRMNAEGWQEREKKSFTIKKLENPTTIPAITKYKQYIFDSLLTSSPSGSERIYNKNITVINIMRTLMSLLSVIISTRIYLSKAYFTHILIKRG